MQTKGRSLNKASDKLRLNDVRATVFVMRRQSAYLKYLLGEEERRPGDVGPSQDHISVPICSNLAQLQGFLPTAHGNIPKGMTEGNLEREYDISAELLRSPRGVDLPTGGEP